MGGAAELALPACTLVGVGTGCFAASLLPPAALASLRQPLSAFRRPLAAAEWALLAAPPLLGCSAPALYFSLVPGPVAAALLGLRDTPIPAATFGAVWALIYSGVGAAALLTLQAGERAREAALPQLAAAFVTTLLFWATNSVRMTAVIDAAGALQAAAAFLALRAVAPRAAAYLLPLVAWMPFTLCVKLAVLAGAFAAPVG